MRTVSTRYSLHHKTSTYQRYVVGGFCTHVCGNSFEGIAYLSREKTIRADQVVAQVLGEQEREGILIPRAGLPAIPILRSRAQPHLGRAYYDSQSLVNSWSASCRRIERTWTYRCAAIVLGGRYLSPADELCYSAGERTFLP
jgi:hypothetical protein